MKKIMVLVTSIVVTMSLGSSVFASDATTLTDQAGITPDSILYSADKAVDNLKVTLSSSEEDKANTLLEIAEERLGESEVMASEDKQDLANTALTDYENNMNEAQTKIEDAIDKAQTSGDEDKLKDVENIENKIIDKQKNSLDVLTKLQDKLPNKAKATVAKVIEMQTAKRNALIAVKKERQIYNDAKKQYNEAKAALETAKQSGDEAAIKAAEDLLQQKKLALDTEKQNLAKAVEAKKEASKISVGKTTKENKGQTKKDSKNNETTSESKKQTSPAPTTPTTTNTTTNTTEASLTSTDSASTPAKSASPKSTSVNSENTKKQTSPTPTLKNKPKTEVTNSNKEDKKDEAKSNNGNGEKKEKSQH
ncbi:hypothetical protein CLRAG_39410 [Clostridium ragsdalei P11]|uniref:DUF5667 domain-containing protein n=1 Tax=Clostridium ragsdalei P11 TaxID=1353534 RepID=A0A1A6AHY5_9CLOT|nr:DUF5667 domain-containing protein [Clostridium ragsdalei]OBR89679.1 hypothetical protein CLRAG_39410 [Clostridium ragsdalei P11]